MIIYIKNPKGASRKLLELFNEYSKVTEYKINTQKPLAFLFTNNGKSERDYYGKYFIHHGNEKNKILMNKFT